MVIAYVPAGFAVLGIVLWFAASNAKVQEVGRVTYFAGFLVTMLSLASKTFHLFG